MELCSVEFTPSMESTIYGFLPIFMQIIFAFGFVFATIAISGFLGPKIYSKRKNANFECGLDPIGDARSPFPIKYFLVALLFVLFDLEVIFMYPLALNFKAMGWEGLAKLGSFVALLGVGYLYMVKKKAFDWVK